MKRQLGWMIMAFALVLTAACSRGAENSGVRENLGNEQGNGTDNVPFGFGSAWVMEPNAIRYCYVLATDFGVPAGQIEAELKAAFSLWRDYIDAKNINESLRATYIQTLGSRFPHGAPQDVLDRAKLFNLSTVSQPMDRCDGSENIRFYFGVEDGLIAKLKQNYFNPTAFASRINYDAQAGSGNGVIWLVKEGGLSGGKGDYPKWELPNRLRGVLLHEIGHAYGVAHIEDTIMREDMWTLLLDSGWSTEDQAKIEYKMAHIDHDMELFFPELAQNKTAYSGYLSFWGSFAGQGRDAEIEENFEFLTGRKPSGDVVSRFERQKLSISDVVSKFDFDIVLDNQHGSAIGTTIFRAERTWPFDAEGMGGASLSLSHKSSAVTGVLKAESGAVVPVTLFQNLGPGPMRMTYLRGGEEKALLVMDRL